MSTETFHAAARPVAQHDTIVVIERALLLRQCLARCIATISGRRVASFATPGDWLAVAPDVSASVVLLCLPSEPGGATWTMDELGRLAAAAPIVVLSGIGIQSDLAGAADIGGFISASLPIEAVVEALRVVEAGGVLVSAGYEPGDATTNAGLGVSKSTQVFTERQASVVEAIRRGKANKAIAHELNLRESTVKVHVRNIMKKLSARNRTEVALMADRLLQRGASSKPAFTGLERGSHPLG